MAEFDFGNDSSRARGAESWQDESAAGVSGAAETGYDGGTGSSGIGETDAAGMTSMEYSDPNKISVTIADKDAPLVVLFGSQTCGKTMTLVRLTRYLWSKGYTVKPDTAFRPLYDKNYSEMCENFNSMINSEDAARSTSKINYMLVKVYDRTRRTLCQILEAPGEHYFKPEKPDEEFPKYVNAIISSNNRKIWVIMLEPDDTNRNMDVQRRRAYVRKVHKLKTSISARDKVIFLFNKIDRTPYVVRPGEVKYGAAKRQIGYSYPDLFVPFTNQNPITKLWKPYNFDFVAFQTGSYSEAADGTMAFVPGADVYPAKLWKFILKGIKG